MTVRCLNLRVILRAFHHEPCRCASSFGASSSASVGVLLTKKDPARGGGSQTFVETLVETLVDLVKNWLVVSTPLKIMKVSWDDYSRYMEK